MSITELSLLERPSLRIERAGNGFGRSWASAPTAPNRVPTGQRYYFGRVEPSFRYDHAFRFDLRFGSFNDWSSLKVLLHMPGKALFFEPMLCDKAEQPPEGPEWHYELKLDGYRAIGFRSDGRAELWSRNGKDFVRRFPEVVKAIESLPEDTAIDGEIVALDADGKPSFALLQGSDAGAVPMVFYAFDLLMLRGRDLRLSRLEERRKRLRQIVDRLPENIRYSETFAVSAATLVRVVRENGLEGIVAKRAGSRYRSGHSGDWLKWRANRGQEFVIGGYLPNSSTFDSLLVGYYEGRDLMYAGRIRAGLVAGSRRALLSHFAKLHIELCPFTNVPERTKGRWGDGRTAADLDKCRWLRPRLVAAVEFLEWTPELRCGIPGSSVCAGTRTRTKLFASRICPGNPN